MVATELLSTALETVICGAVILLAGTDGEHTTEGAGTASAAVRITPDEFAASFTANGVDGVMPMLVGAVVVTIPIAVSPGLNLFLG